MLTKEQILDYIKSNKIELMKKYHLTKIGIFGSYVRNEQDSISDIDILVEFGKPVGIEFIDLADELEELLKHKVDLVSINGIKPKYLKEIEQEIVYA